MEQLISIFFLLYKTQKTPINGQNIYRKEGIQTPFSIFRYIVIDPEKYSSDELQELIRHEKIHVRQCHSLGSECDTKAARAVKEMPKWIPGKQKGNPVSVWYNLPVQFRLSNEPATALPE